MPVLAFAQSNQERLVQLSGVIVTGDSLSPVPYTGIMIKSSSRGTVSDYYGFFSIVAHVGDEIEFSSVGFAKTNFKVPDTLTENRYSLIQILNRDTVLLNQAVIYPWPTREQFKQAFLDLKVPDTDMDHARRNLALETMREESIRIDMDGSMNSKFVYQKQQSRLYNTGQLPVNNLLNPIAWAKFIQAWKSGEFKSKSKDD
ncbi:MAG: carboxypeptidase-like regulatory domain-containing protein [Bacteroidetes bacterium]|nr:carboxypeptidase-like regulatory domain-containing protein [Bacteroidota bacterium]MBX7239453.1 carboxypeptidase-like regulatory domain-containing protein [Bacteroidia bacterium]MCC7515381.1 carboxypeptidase-like regulatory domain-containing protein [Bacteroidia bacterium]MCW5919697.1 carboxypeptidase-like regulatory domain-containing protein [Bacteroidota bacterium]HMU76965.1 carboxypeptidase-like regulatory domain-containing protein [Bacteroidia bacterium]